MNLKEASRRLGVHYQTAYKWVRTGQLTAVRVGGSYDISEAAIARLTANRRSVTAEHVAGDPAQRLTGSSPDRVLDELESMAADPLVAAPSAATFACRRGAEALGDLCLVVLMNRDGQHVDYAVLDHPEPERAAFINAMLATTAERRTMSRNAAAAAYFSGRTVRVPHVAQDDLRTALLPTLRQYLEYSSIHSLVSAPITDAGTPVGFVAFSRDTPGRPYTSGDEQFATQLGQSIGRLAQTAREVALAWKIRSELAEDLRTHITGRGQRRQPDAHELDRALHEHADSIELPVAIFGADSRFIGANERLLSESGYPLESIIGQEFDAFTHPDDRSRERHGFAQLVSGELDYHDMSGRCILVDGTEAQYAVHRAAVRSPDATLACVVSIGRLLHLKTTAPEGTGATK